jgi:tetratricopeptide (TPR) repeat protein
LNTYPEYRAWVSHETAENASELLELAVFLGFESDVQDVALWVLRRKDDIEPQAVRLARFAIGQIKPFGEEAEQNLNSALNHGVRSRILRKLKKRTYDNPLDSITFAEMSRLYFLSGQREKSKECIERAIKISPNNRFVLRNAAQLFQGLAEADRALYHIWRSDAVRADPWVQAAEVALADRCERSPKFGTYRIGELLEAQGQKQTSELAAGLASLELKNGSKLRRIRKLMRNSLDRVTENALAQILWVEDETGVSVNAEGQAAGLLAAHEAQSRVLYDVKDYRGAQSAAEKWLQDQPFSVDAARDYMFISGVHLENYELAAKVGKEALKIHPNDHTLVNAQFHALAMTSDLDGAKELLSKLETFRANNDAVPFIHAGRGLLAFRLGHIFEGREHYLKAVDSARDLKRNNLATNALIYWLEQEVLSGEVSNAEAVQIAQKIETTIKKSKKSFQKDIMPTWDSKKRQIFKIEQKDDLVVMGEVRSPGGIRVEYGVRRSNLSKVLDKTVVTVD